MFVDETKTKMKIKTKNDNKIKINGILILTKISDAKSGKILRIFVHTYQHYFCFCCP